MRTQQTSDDAYFPSDGQEKLGLRRSKWRLAFTLVELLVTIATMAVLSGIMLPVLSQATAAARRLQCINNQRQLAIAWTLYPSDNHERLVANGENAPPSTINREWVQGGFVYAPYSVDPKYVSDPQFALFASYIRASKLYLCPGDPPNIEISQQSLPRVRSYALNNYLGWEGQWDERLSTDFQVFRKQSEISPNPADIFLFQDVNPKSICWPFFGVSMYDDAFFNFPSSAHSRGGVISYSDGHVLHHRWKDERTITAFASNYHHHQQASEGNPDLAWLRNHTTVPGDSGYEQP